jgi:hypothetical protein
MIEALLVLIFAFMVIFAACSVALVIIAMRRTPQRSTQYAALPEPTRKTRLLR